MKQLIQHKGKAILLERSNIDTDQIIPKQFLKKIERTGYGIHLFHDWRFLDAEAKEPNPTFELNQPSAKNVTVLIAGENFGCGSSREHAPWALSDYGFKIILAPSFADIFYNNAIKNGILPIVLDSDTYTKIIDWYKETSPQSTINVSLPQQTLEYGKELYKFEIDAFPKKRLLEGLDDISITLKHMSSIEEFEKKYEHTYSYYSLPKV